MVPNVKTLSRLVTIFCMIVALIFTWGIPEKSVYATGTTYYVSLGGNNSTGTSWMNAWTSVSQISSRTFIAGDTIKIRCGDAFSGQVLRLKGNGNAAAGNWITLTSSTTSNVACTSTTRPKITNDATAGVHEYVTDAMFDLRNPASNATVAIYIDNYSGWNINSLEVANAEMGIVAKNSTMSAADGLWIENCDVHDITGFNVAPYPNMPAFTWAPYSIGIGISYLSPPSLFTNVKLFNNTVENTDGPFYLSGLKGALIQGNKTDNSYHEGLEFHWVYSADYPAVTNPSIIRNNTILNSGVNGMDWGTAALQLDDSHGVLVEGNEVAYTVAANGPDGVGIDIEQYNSDITLSRNYVHDNVGSGVLVNYMSSRGTASENYNSFLTNNYIVGNGAKNEGSFLKTAGTEVRTSKGVIRDNYSERYTTELINFLWSSNIHTDSFPSGYVIENNTTAATQTRRTWEFNVYNSTDGWAGTQGIGSVNTNNYNYNTTIINNTYPIMTSADSLNIDLSNAKHVKIRYKNSTGNSLARLYFTTTTNTTFDDNKSIWKTVNANDPNYTEYDFDFTNNSYWTGALKQLRFDPSSTSTGTGTFSGTFSIDYIRIASSKEGIPKPNLLINGGFEDNSSWTNTTWSTGTITTGHANTGSQSLQIGTGGSNWQQVNEISSSKQYNLSAYSYRDTSGDTSDGWLTIWYYDSSNTKLTTETSVYLNPANTSYTKSGLASFTPPSGTSYAKVIISRSSGSGNMYVDDVYFAEN